MIIEHDGGGEDSATSADESLGTAATGEVEEHDCGDPHCGEHPHAAPFRREAPKTGRNDPCPCGSGKKFKKCCIELGR